VSQPAAGGVCAVATVTAKQKGSKNRMYLDYPIASLLELIEVGP
jgi:hypothetical protein